jgi:hypothetical protein
MHGTPNKSQENLNKLDPNFELQLGLQMNLDDLRSSIRPYFVAGEVTPKQLSKSQEEAAEYLKQRLFASPDGHVFNTRGAELVSQTIVKKLTEDPQLRKLFRDVQSKYPKDVEHNPTMNVSRTETAVRKKEAFKNSEVQVPLYRAVHSFHDKDRDYAALLPRELGIHVGTLEQATSIVGQDMLPAHSTKFHFQNSDKLKNAKEMLTFIEENPGDVEALPYMMMKGYAKVENPLEMEDMVTGWWFARELKYDQFVSSFKKLVSSQLPKNRNLSYGEISKLEGIQDRAKRLQVMPGDGLLGSLQYELQQIAINREIVDWLKGIGFDSIKYKNTAEASLKDDGEYSYILFDNAQFKPVWNKTFDTKDPRQTHSSGGLVKALKRSQEN